MHTTSFVFAATTFMSPVLMNPLASPVVSYEILIKILMVFLWLSIFLYFVDHLRFTLSKRNWYLVMQETAEAFMAPVTMIVIGKSLVNSEDSFLDLFLELLALPTAVGLVMSLLFVPAILLGACTGIAVKRLQKKKVRG